MEATDPRDWSTPTRLGRAFPVYRGFPRDKKVYYDHRSDPTPTAMEDRWR